GAAGGGAAAAGREHRPAPAPDHLQGAALRAAGVLLRTVEVVVLLVPVGAPLLHVAVHVVQADRVSRVRSGRAGALARILPPGSGEQRVLAGEGRSAGERGLGPG